MIAGGAQFRAIRQGGKRSTSGAPNPGHRRRDVPPRPRRCALLRQHVEQVCSSAESASTSIESEPVRLEPGGLKIRSACRDALRHRNDLVSRVFNDERCRHVGAEIWFSNLQQRRRRGGGLCQVLGGFTNRRWRLFVARKRAYVFHVASAETFVERDNQKAIPRHARGATGVGHSRSNRASIQCFQTQVQFVFSRADPFVGTQAIEPVSGIHGVGGIWRHAAAA